jgi:hypothetical protein
MSKAPGDAFDDQPSVRSGSALERARHDAEEGRLWLARHRLKGYLVDRPGSLQARRLLAELYRRDGYPDQAGRWGYLVDGGATDRERMLFERSATFPFRGIVNAEHLRLLLRWTGPVESAPGFTRAVLRDVDRRAAEQRAAYRYLRPTERISGLARAVLNALLERLSGGPRR